MWRDNLRPYRTALLLNCSDYSRCETSPLLSSCPVARLRRDGERNARHEESLLCFLRWAILYLDTTVVKSDDTRNAPTDAAIRTFAAERENGIEKAGVLPASTMRTQLRDRN